MLTDDFFCAHLDQMIDLHHSLALLSEKVLWGMLEESLWLVHEHRDRKGRQFFLTIYLARTCR